MLVNTCKARRRRATAVIRHRAAIALFAIVLRTTPLLADLAARIDSPRPQSAEQ